MRRLDLPTGTRMGASLSGKVALYYHRARAKLVLTHPDGTETELGAGGGGGSGDVVGPSSSVASEVALFDGTTGKLLKRATGSGIAKLASGVLSVVTSWASAALTGTANHVATFDGSGNASSKAVGSGAGTICAGDDSRLSDARTPTGSAGGDLSGTYPNPGVAKVSGTTPGTGGLAVLDDATVAAVRTTIEVVPGAAPPWMPAVVTEGDYDWDQYRPGVLQLAPMKFPAATISDLESTLQGFTTTNPANGAAAMVATGGLGSKGYVRFTPVVAGGYLWNTSTQAATRPYRDYAPINSSSSDAQDDQYWVVCVRVPSSVTLATARGMQTLLSNAAVDISATAEVARASLRGYGAAGVWDILTDSLVVAPTSVTSGVSSVGTTAVWFRFHRAAASRTVTIAYNLGGGSTPPTSWTTFATHTNLLASATATARFGFNASVATDLSTAWSGDVLYFDDTLALPRLDARQLARYAAAIDTVPVPCWGFNPNSPEVVLMQDVPVPLGMTDAKLRAILTAAVNVRTGLDAATWTFKAEKGSVGSYSGGSFAAAGSVSIASSGEYIRITAKAASTNGQQWGSVDVGRIARWSTA